VLLPRLAWVLLAGSAAFAGWAGWVFATSAGPASGVLLGTASREIAALNTVDAQQIPAWEARWLADTTGAEHAQVAATNPAALTQIRRVKTSSVGTVTAIAVTSLGGSTAGVIATVKVVQTASSGATSTITNRYAAVLALTPAGWKISSLRDA